MLRILSRQTTLPALTAGRFSVCRFFSSRRSSSEQSSSFITVPEDKIDFVINRYKAVGGNASPNDINSRVVVSFNVNEAAWMPENVKKVFMQQQAMHIDDNGVFTLISSLHRSIVANRVEIMRKLQKKVNQACISTLDKHTIGVVDPSVNEKRLKEKRKRSELSRRRRQVDKDYDMEDFF
ncbi:hypothetical protein WA588_004085 [Blastocystis sp. NMH]